MARALQDTIVLLGDSLTQRQECDINLQSCMSKAYLRRMDVLNRGYGGYNSEWIWELFPEIFASKDEIRKTRESSTHVRMVTIWLGTNDSCLPPSPQECPLQKFEANLDSMLFSFTQRESSYAIAENPCTFILITPGPPLMTMLNDRQFVMRSVENTKRYRDAVVKTHQRWSEKLALQSSIHQVLLVDCWSALIDAAGGSGEELRPFYIDGLHCSSKGYEVLWKEISALIKNECKGRSLDFDDYEDLPFRVPPWDIPYHQGKEAINPNMKWPKFLDRGEKQ